MIKIEIMLRESYGNLRCYPVETPDGESPAALLARIAGTKTLSARTLELAEAMGLEIITQDNPAALDWRQAV